MRARNRRLQPLRIDEATLHDLKSRDPSAYLQARGFTVQREGRHLEVKLGRDQIYRISQTSDGWMSCLASGEGIGDNLSLTQSIEHCDFPTAARIFAGVVAVSPPAPTESAPPALSPESDVEVGTAYLLGRGIHPEVVAHAHHAGFLHFVEGAVFYCGRDQSGVVRNAQLRGYSPSGKRCLKGSSTAYPPILTGSARDHLVVVEGGTDALALQTLAHRAGVPAPSVLVSGGLRVRSWLRTPHVVQLLRSVPVVAVAADREKAEKIRVSAAIDRGELRRRISEITTRPVEEFWPPAGAKDLADYTQSTNKNAQESSNSPGQP